MAGGGPPRSNLPSGGFLDSAQHRQAQRAREERQRREREAYRRAGLVHRTEPNYQEKVKKQFTDYAKQAHGLNQQQAEKQYRDVVEESYLAGQRNSGGRGGSAPGGGSASNINTVSRNNAAIKPVTVRSRSGGFPLMGGAVMAGAQQLTGLGGGMPYVANSIFDRLDEKVGQGSHLNPTFNYYQSSVNGPQSVRAIQQPSPGQRSAAPRSTSAAPRPASVAPRSTSVAPQQTRKITKTRPVGSPAPTPGASRRGRNKLGSAAGPSGSQRVSLGGRLKT